jgi:hypothetical protein
LTIKPHWALGLETRDFVTHFVAGSPAVLWSWIATLTGEMKS